MMAMIESNRKLNADLNMAFMQMEDVVDVTRKEEESCVL
jgi:hypothetical protein